MYGNIALALGCTRRPCRAFTGLYPTRIGLTRVSGSPAWLPQPAPINTPLEQVTWHGRNWDVLVGLTAPVMAWLVAAETAPPRVAAAWNVAGLLILGNTVATVLTSVPGALKLAWPGEPFAEFASWRLICLPAFLAPLAVFLHIASLRQNLSAGTAATLRQKEM